ncbi:MAG TPA: hypothetical protein VMU05_01725 [Dongiaceae bacterium]|nr:hypothetical protein [Dongiaceae bacterium]
MTKARAQNNDTLTDYARELMNDALVTSDKLSKALCRVQRMHDNLHIQLSLLVEEVYHMHGLGRVDVD